MPRSLRQAGWTAAALLCVVTAAPAQQLINKEQEEQFARARFPYQQRVLTGQDKATKEQSDLAARYFVLRVTNLEARNEPKVMQVIVKDFEGLMAIAANESNAKVNREAVALLTPPMIQRFKEVFELDFMPNSVAVVNAAIMLPHLARLKQEEIADFLTGLIADPKKHDAIRVHALKGLRDYFPAKAFTKLEQTQKPLIARRDRELKRVEALLAMIDRPMPPTNDPQELDAFRFIRREAVTTLAEAQVPAISSVGKLEGNVAQGLLKVLAKKNALEPSFTERFEAAIGVCQMRSRDVEEYDPAIGIYLVGECLKDFAAEYKKDLANIKLGAKTRLPTFLAWKIESKRFEVALNQMAQESRAPAAKTLAAAATPMLRAMASADAIDDSAVRKAVASIRPKANTLYKGALKVDFDFEPPMEGQ